MPVSTESLDPALPPDALVAVFTTVATRDDALRLAHALVDAGLVACAQVERIDSVYRWDGRVHEEPELRLLLKTTAAAWPAVRAQLLARHPYELPAIYAVPVAAAHAPYAAWVAGSVRG